MKFLDSLLGRTQAKTPDLDSLFALPSASVALEVATGLRPSGQAAVAFKPASGGAFVSTVKELDELLDLSAQQSQSTLQQVDDDYGYHWVVVSDPDLSDLVATVHLVNATLDDAGFGPQLLCSVIGFAGEAGPCHLVYLFKRGTFYPFAPRSGERRDNERELQVRAALGAEVPVEPDLSRWFPLWGLPIQ